MLILLTMLFSLIGLLWAANHLVTGASGIAQHYYLSPLIIGLTIIAIGTSAPEIMVAITAASKGRTELALGNAIGANIANIGLVLGVTILYRPLTIRSSFLRQEYPILLVIMLFTYSLMLDSHLGVLDGCLFLTGCLCLIGYFLVKGKKSRNDALSKEFKQTIGIKRSMGANVLSFGMGVLILPISAHYLVHSAIVIAKHWGVSDLTMGLTILAFGTCLPNIATCLVAAFKGQDDLAVGCILGSNMFNLLLVMAFPAIISPAKINPSLLTRDIPVMFIITFVLLLISYHYKSKVKIERWHGGLLLLIYCCYVISLVVKGVKYSFI